MTNKITDTQFQHLIDGAALFQTDEMDASEEAQLRAVVEYAKAAEAMVARQVAIARSMGQTWQQIGDTLGTTRQAAQQRYGTH